MNLTIPEDVLDLMHTLQENGFECYVVGGTIRDMLLDLETHDYDLTTNATPDEMLSIFSNRKTIPTGIKHGTLTILTNSFPVEITTYRKDSEYLDHRHPSSVTFSTSLKEDCARRDFTINALCYSEEDGIIDFYEGQEDLKKHLIRCIGKAEERFEEDALRILRALRFQTQLDFQIEEDTKKAIFTKKDLLKEISIERIHEEVSSILNKPCASLFTEYKEIFMVFLPQIEKINDFSSLDSEGTPLTRMAILLKDESDIEKILDDFKYSNQEERSILNYINHKDDDLNSRIEIKKCISSIPDDFYDYIYFRHALDSSIDIEAMHNIYQEVIDNNECISLNQLEINGNDLLELGLKGKEISSTLQSLLNDVIEDNIPNEKDALLDKVKASL